MMSFRNISMYYFVCVAVHGITLSNAATFSIQNNCPYTVWAAAAPGGGRQLDHGQVWDLNVSSGVGGARIWARTGCEFNESGQGKCQTGDCGGLLQCQGYGLPPNTLAEYTLNQFDGMDFFDISLVDGFNVPMEFSPASGGCNRGIKCTSQIVGQCPSELQTPGGCNNPCTVFKTDEYCCNSGKCGPTNFSSFFKERCPDAYSYPKDDETSTFTCPTATNYKLAKMKLESLSPFFFPFVALCFTVATAATFTIRNNCSYTVWAAAVAASAGGGGKRLESGATWNLNVMPGTRGARIWARTNCQFDEAGRGRCKTGDCGGRLKCKAYGKPPNTLAEFALNQYKNLDFFHISLVDGYNVPMEFSPTSGLCKKGIQCTADIVRQCPKELKAPGGCNNPCTVFKTQQYCCYYGKCGPTDFSKFFKARCPNA
ncbi:protein P21-like [Gossypium australe]|uniref:Protein P21-like n=1 Tax=Gossypium australe TaxID=47621 RepID=A0A5B6UUP0_9ROSI|nr:protein P21-like [Gossypium australe]